MWPGYVEIYGYTHACIFIRGAPEVSIDKGFWV